MGDTRNNVDLPTGEWIDLYVESSIPLGEAILVENVGSHDVYLAVQATQPLKDHDAYNIVKRYGGKLQNSFDDSGAWAFCPNQGGKLNVSKINDAEGFNEAMGGFGNLPFSAFFTEVSKGNVPGHRPLRFNGHNPNLGTTIASIWGVLDTVVQQRNTAVQMFISSTSPNDSAAGTGMQEARIDALLADYSEITIDIELDGQTQVPLPVNTIAVNKIRGIRAGTSEGNEGIVYVGTGTAVGGVPPVVDNLVDVDSDTGIGDNVSQSGFITVPLGFSLFGVIFVPSVEAGKGVEVYIYDHDPVNDLLGSLGSYKLSAQLNEITLIVHTPVQERHLVDFRARVTTGSADVTVAVMAILVENKYIEKAYSVFQVI